MAPSGRLLSVCKDKCQHRTEEIINNQIQKIASGFINPMLFLYLSNLQSSYFLSSIRLYSFFDKVSRTALHLGINLADIDTRDAHTRGDDASDKPHGNEHGSPALDGLARKCSTKAKIIMMIATRVIARPRKVINFKGATEKEVMPSILKLSILVSGYLLSPASRALRS